MFGFFAKLFGTKSERDLKALQPYVAKINAAYRKLEGLTHDELRAATIGLKDHIRGAMQQAAAALDQARELAHKSTSASIEIQDTLYKQVSDKEHAYKQQLEEVLTTLLPEAFAIMKETARRFKTYPEIATTATLYDREVASRNDYVTLEGDRAIWKNHWQAAGSTIRWDMVHYDVQLTGGVILHQGKVAEMATGEGKTLVATLPAFLNALAGEGVHIVTVNDYLAQRDAAWMKPLYEFHGLRVDCINAHPPHSPERRAAYQADIVYGTNNEFGFDYLRDNMTLSAEEVVQRAPHFAMIDEVDSVLIDDARTPLIISGPVSKSNEQTYVALQPRVQSIYNAQREIVAEFLQDAKRQITSGDKKAGGLALFRAYRGLPKHKALIKYLSQVGTKQLMRATENYYLQENSKLMPEADAPLLFTLDEKQNSVELTEKGLEYITQAEEDADFFVLPDVGSEIARIETDADVTEEQKVAEKDKLLQDYATKSERIHVLSQLLKAYALFDRDVEYIVSNGQVCIVDEQTGRVLEGRRYSDGLHQAIEAKEHVRVQRASQTYATITLQNYFRMYHKLAGMTGTASTEAGELWEIYKLDVVTAPTHRPIVREDKEDKVYKSAREKFEAVAQEIKQLVEQHRPVLVGTTSVEMSELVSRLLDRQKISHQVLNAKQHQKEAQIVAGAGVAGQVTIATNMAGRGTDIKLTPEAKAAGGLAIVGTERHESRRVDRQLRGRAGRQGDVGSSQFFVSLEDDLMRLFSSERIIRLMDRLGLEEGEVIQHSMVTRSIERAQKKVEQSNFAVRKRLLEYDNVMNAQREVVYKRRKHALLGQRLHLEVMRATRQVLENMFVQYASTPDLLHKELGRCLGHAFAGAYQVKAHTGAKPWHETYAQAMDFYQKRKRHAQEDIYEVLAPIHAQGTQVGGRFAVPFTDGRTIIRATADLEECIASKGESLLESLEQAVILRCLDRHWKNHLKDMDALKQSVQNAVYERQDPLLVYKFEAYKQFQQFVLRVDEAIVSFLYTAVPQTHDPSAVPSAEELSPQTPRGHAEKPTASAFHATSSDATPASIKLAPSKTTKVAARNQRVTVQYKDGTLKKDVKYKTVENDLAGGLCVLVE